MYQIINCVRDYEKLQNDTDIVSRWIDINELALNCVKCKYMVVSRLKSRAVPSQTVLLYGQLMERVINYRYLGVFLTEDLSCSWSLHIDKISCKTWRMLYRQFYRWATTSRLYLCLIWPHAPKICCPCVESLPSKIYPKARVYPKICIKSVLKELGWVLMITCKPVTCLILLI